MVNGWIDDGVRTDGSMEGWIEVKVGKWMDVGLRVRGAFGAQYWGN